MPYTYPPIDRRPKVISARFLSEDERITIADLLRMGKTVRAIARELDRSAATISREIRRDADPGKGVCHPHRARQRAVVRRARSGEGKRRASAAPTDADAGAAPGGPSRFVKPGLLFGQPPIKVIERIVPANGALRHGCQVAVVGPAPIGARVAAVGAELPADWCPGSPHVGGSPGGGCGTRSRSSSYAAGSTPRRARSSAPHPGCRDDRLRDDCANDRRAASMITGMHSTDVVVRQDVRRAKALTGFRSVSVLVVAGQFPSHGAGRVAADPLTVRLSLLSLDSERRDAGLVEP